MYTGYFAQLKKYEAAGLIPISICGKAPDWYNGLQYKVLAPKWAFFKEWKDGSHKGDNEYYIEHFNAEVLSNITARKVIRDIESLSGVSSKDIILICYEKPSDFCHRHLVADWLKENGVDCIEFEI